MSDLIPGIVLDKLWQGACLSSYHPDGDQRFKLLNYGRAVVTEALARLPGWQPGNPDIPKGTEREFIVAVRRKYNGKVFVFGRRSRTTTETTCTPTKATNSLPTAGITKGSTLPANSIASIGLFLTTATK